jgi:membrane-associated phospholipid phosphatase
MLSTCVKRPNRGITMARVLTRRSLALEGLISLAIAFAAASSALLWPAAESLDSLLFSAINSIIIPDALSSLLVAASLYGREYFWVGVVGAMLLLGRRDAKLLAVELSMLFVIGIVVGDVTKSVIYRPRPPLVLSGAIVRVPLDSDSSFPSGHALIVAAGSAFSLLRFRRRLLAFALTLEAALVCFSRVYVGVHFPLDVLGGAAFGVAVACFGLIFAEGPLQRAFESLADSLVRLLGRGAASV